MCINPVVKPLKNAWNVQIGKSLFPCGGCIGCRLDQQLLWSARCQSDYVHYPSTFLTLTYDDYHLNYVNDMALYPTLDREQLGRFVDNLRHQVKNLPSLPKGSIKDFSYFGCGEYGDMFHRPHYHILIFGLDYIDFKSFYEKLWPNGQIKSLPVAQGGIRYVVDYMCKNINGLQAENEFDKKGLERPFYITSRGLGSELFINHRDEIAKTGLIKIGSRRIPVPTYYKNLCTRYDTDTLIERLKNRRIQYLYDVRDSIKMKMSYDDYMSFKRKSKEKSLSNDLIKHGKPVLNLDFHKDNSYIDINLIYNALYA